MRRPDAPRLSPSRQRLRPLFASMFAALFLYGCGGSGGGGGEGPSSTQSLSGRVTDPPIEAAAVRLVDAAGDALSTVVRTDAQGRFTLGLPEDADLTGARLIATGGSDPATGYTFQGLTLQGLYTPGRDQLISPLTTLMVAEMDRSGGTADQAREALAARFALSPDAVNADPAGDAAAQRISLQLTRLAAALRAHGGFTRVAELTAAHGPDWNAIIGALLVEPLPDSVVQRLALLEDELFELDGLDTSGTAADLVEQANRLALRRGVLHFLNEQLGYAPAAGSTAEANAMALAEALWEANARRGVPVGGAQIANLLRYTFQAYAITTADLDAADFEPPAGLSMDAHIPALARLTVLDHRLPLTPGEALGEDNAARMAYFYGSDLSPYYQAEQLFTGVFDDAVLDPLYKSIAAGLVAAGLDERAEVVLQSQIFQPAIKADAYRLSGRNLHERGEVETALAYWETARRIYDDYVEAKGGAANLDADDASFYQTISSYYEGLDMLDEAEATLAPVMGFVEREAGQPYSTTYGRVVAGLMNLARGKVEAAEAAGLRTDLVADAEQTVELFGTVLNGVGYQTTGSCSPHFKLKTFYTTDLAEFYARLDLREKALEAIGRFNALREEACNRAQTDVYARYMAPVYGLLGMSAEYRRMVEETVDPDSSHYGRALAAILVYEAAELAKAGEVDNAVRMIVEAYPDDLDERLEYLTNAGINRQGVSRFLAVLLLEDGHTTEGAAVLDAAWDLAVSDDYRRAFPDDGWQAIRLGCAKIAQLTYDYVDQAQGRERMQECIAITADYASAGTTLAANEAYRHLAEGLFSVGLGSAGVDAVNEALSYVALLPEADYFEELRRTLLYPIEAGGIARGLDPEDLFTALEEAEDRYASLSESAATDEQRAQAFEAARLIAASHADIAEGLRRAAAQTGSITPAHREAVHTARMRAAEVMEGAVDLAAALASDADRAAKFMSAVQTLSQARAFDAAAAVLQRPGQSASDLNALRQLIADAMIAADDFPGTDISRHDLDGDAAPDFYSPLVGEDEILASPLRLDTDIDDDGTPDSLDPTPFCAACPA